MTTSKLQIKPEECSEIGLLILEEMKKHELTFTQIANKIDISQAALRITCHKQGNLGKKMIPKLANILHHTEDEINRLIQENSINQMYKDN